MEYKSTSLLARDHDIIRDDLFDHLKSLNWIERDENSKWALTDLGEHVGGHTKRGKNGGEYIVWPANVSINYKQIKTGKKVFKSTSKLADEHGVSRKALFDKLLSLNLIKRDNSSAWILTATGKKKGGRMIRLPNGNKFIVWPSDISINYYQLKSNKKPFKSTTNFRNKWELRATSNKNDADEYSDYEFYGDDYKALSQHEGYNDNLDLNQQSDEFWDQI